MPLPTCGPRLSLGSFQGLATFSSRKFRLLESGKVFALVYLDGIDESDICVLSRTNPSLKELREVLEQKGYKTVQVAPGQADNRAKSGIRLSTMCRSKGLEFSAVAMVRVNEDIVPPKGLLSLAPNAAIRTSLVAGEKSLVHVSATRAKRRLLVSSSGQPSELIAHLEPAQREPAE
jgi:superfamily I DNA/RNA helicase